MSAKRPKFLTGIAAVAVNAALKAVLENPAISNLLRRQHCHIVILVPEVTEGDDWMKSTTSAHCLYEHSVGAESDWQHPFKDIARSKANQLWQGRSTGNFQTQFHLLCQGETLYWGGVAREGIVVTCSGFQEYFDRLIAGIVADTLIALALNNWDTSDDKKDVATFLT
jgi:hypothetical protein